MSGVAPPGLVESLASRRAYDKGAEIFRARAEARHVFYLVRGRVVLRRYGPGGEDVVIHAAQAGEFFAEASLHSGRYHCTAVAATDVEVACLDAGVLASKLRSDPDFAMAWLAIVSRQLRGARARIERLSLRHAAERIRHLLITEGQGERPSYTLRGTLRELAGELGLTHEALYRTLAAMERDGTLARRDGTLVLLRSPAPG